MPDWRTYVGERLRGASLSRERAAEIQEELAVQLEDAYREALASGATEEEARARAEAHVPDWTGLGREVRRARAQNGTTVAEDVEAGLDRAAEQGAAGRVLADLGRDLLYALRTLRRTPAFTAAAVVTLGLGIGANSAVFSIVDAVLFRPLPVKAPEELVALATEDHHGELPHGLSYADFEDVRNGATAFAGVTAYSPVQLSLATADRAELVWGVVTSGDYFPMLGVTPFLGRTFGREAEAGGGSPPEVVLGYGFWQRKFGGDPGVVGRSATLNGKAATIVGVAPPDFTGLEVIFAPDLFVPAKAWAMQLATQGPAFLTQRDDHSLRVWARLAPGTSFEQAAAALAVQARSLADAYPATNRDVKLSLFPSWEARFEPGSGKGLALGAGMLLAVVALVTLIACANVANLLLSRASARQKELAVRVALGAGRGRLVRQVLVEGLVLSLLGGALAALLASAGVRSLAALLYVGSLPLRLDFRVDPRVLGFTALLAVATTLLCALVPALRASRVDAAGSLKGGDLAAPGRGRRLSLRDGLVVAQMALSLVLLITASLFLKTLHNAQGADLGLRKSQAVMASMTLGLQGYDEPRGRAFQRDLLDRVRALRGVEAAALAYPMPLEFDADSYDVIPDGREAPPDKEKVGFMGSQVSSGYFQAAGTRLLAGRDFDARDVQGAPGVAIVNETAARKYWPGRDPVGQRLFLDSRTNAPLEIVGVAQDGKYRMYFEDPQPYLYLPLEQRYRTRVTVLLHSARDTAGLVVDLRQAVAALDPNLPLYGVRSMETFLTERTFAGPRLLVALLGTFGLIGLALASVGMYAVMAYAVSRRTREIGIRVAIGASPAEVMGLVLGRGTALAVMGALIGVVGALGLAQVVRVMLFGVRPADPATFALAPLGLLAVALLASYVPARRAMRVSPTSALRQD